MIADEYRTIREQAERLRRGQVDESGIAAPTDRAEVARPAPPTPEDVARVRRWYMQRARAQSERMTRRW